MSGLKIYDDSTGTFGASKAIMPVQRVPLLDIRLKDPGVYVLHLDFLTPTTRERVPAYNSAHFEVRIGVRAASHVLKLVPGIHAVLADTLQIVAVGPLPVAVVTWNAVASGASSQAAPFWTEV